MALNQEVRIRAVGKLKHIPSTLGIAVAMLAFWGMWKISPQPTFVQQDKMLRIKANESHHFPMDFANTSSGNIQNEGKLFFKGNITNYGKMGCGSCKSGRVNIELKSNRELYVRGSEPILMYEAQISGNGKLVLENEIQIQQHLLLDSTLLYSDRKSENSFVHFFQEAEYTLSKHLPYLETWIGRTGQGDFCFPLGGAEGQRYLHLAGRYSKSFFKATYFSKVEPSVYPVAPISPSLQYRPLEGVGMWVIRGEEKVHPAFGLENFHHDIGIVGFQNGQWRFIHSTMTTHGISTKKAIIPNEYEAFSLVIMNP